MSGFLRQYGFSLGLSIAAHTLLAAATMVSLANARPVVVPPPAVTIKATMVDGERLREEAEQRLQQGDEKRLAEQERGARVEREATEAAAAREREAQQRRQREQDKQAREAAAEQQRLAALRAEEAAQRKREADEAAARKRAEELKAQREREAREEARRRQQEAARAAAQRAREAAEAEARKQAESEMMLALQAEEHRRSVEASGMLARYVNLIRQKVERNWNRPPSAATGLSCELRVRQIPGGEVVGVEFGRCNGDAAVMRSIEAAVYKASPLPEPPDATLFRRQLTFLFEPD